MKPREIKREMHRRGWKLVRIKGDHHHYQHPNYAGTVTVPILNQDKDFRAGRRWRNFLRTLDRLVTHPRVRKSGPRARPANRTPQSG